MHISKLKEIVLKIASEKVKSCKVPEVHHVKVMTLQEKKKREKKSMMNIHHHALKSSL